MSGNLIGYFIRKEQEKIESMKNAQSNRNLKKKNEKKPAFDSVTIIFQPGNIVKTADST